MSTGWNFFYALLIADWGVIVSQWLGLEGKTPWLIGLAVFVVFVVLFSINSMIRRRRKAREAEMENKLAEAQEAAMNCENKECEEPTISK